MMSETKLDGAAVTRKERTEGVGRAAARECATGPSDRRTAGSVGKAVMPTREALHRCQQVNNSPCVCVIYHWTEVLY